MSITIGLVANVYNEINALPGWLETHLPFFDDVRVLHAGPQGARSDDGTIELLEKWRVPVEYCAIDDGFGAVRTRAIRMSPCDYVMLLDADERFYPVQTVLQCDGQPTPHGEVDRILSTYHFRDGNVPDWEALSRLGADLKVYPKEAYNQGAELRDVLGHWKDYTTQRPDVVATRRRHWHDLSMRRPTQHWDMDPDWQMRLVRRCNDIYYDSSTRMHEHLVGARHVYRGTRMWGPFFDHFHFHFKRMEQAQRAHDVAVYDAIHEGKEAPTWGKFKS